MSAFTVNNMSLENHKEWSLRLAHLTRDPKENDPVAERAGAEEAEKVKAALLALDAPLAERLLYTALLNPHLHRYHRARYEICLASCSGYDSSLHLRNALQVLEEMEEQFRLWPQKRDYAGHVAELKETVLGMLGDEWVFVEGEGDGEVEGLLDCLDLLLVEGEGEWEVVV